jgi:hypothetical protein
MTSLEERPLTITNDDVRLEAAIHDGEGTLAAVVLHPHPQHGGDMDNHVVTAVAAALAGRGATTIRFNFRGTGASTGIHAGGHGEASDARAAVVAAHEAAPEAKLILVGYSFGAMIAAAIAAEVDPAALILISPPVGMSPLPDGDPGVPTLVVAGDRDQIAPAATVQAMAAMNCRAVVVPGVDHSWWPGIDLLADEIETFLDSLRC